MNNILKYVAYIFITIAALANDLETCKIILCSGLTILVISVM